MSNQSKGSAMKKIVNVTEVEGEGLFSLLGEVVHVWSLNYIYRGTLVGVNDDVIRLDDASVVYETGPLQSAPINAQKLPHPAYVRIGCIEMFHKAP